MKNIFIIILATLLGLHNVLPSSPPVIANPTQPRPVSSIYSTNSNAASATPTADSRDGGSKINAISESGFSYSLSTYCRYGERRAVSVVCPLSGIRVKHNCSGQEGEYRSMCPRVYSASETACRLFAATKDNISDCSVHSYNDVNATCRCRVRQDSNHSGNTTSAVAIWSNITTPMGGLTARREADVTSGGGIQTSFYKYNGSYAPDERAVEIFVIFLYMFAAFLIWICMTLLSSNDATAGSIAAEGDRNAHGVMMAAGYFDLTIADSVSNPSRAAQLVAHALPAVYDLGDEANRSHSSSSSRLLGGSSVAFIVSSNRWIRFFFRDSSWSSHTDGISSIAGTFISALTAMLLATVMYHITDIDDDYCYQQVSRQECLADRTAFYNGEFVCRWDDSATRCQFRRPVDNPINICYVAVVIALCCAPVTYWLVQVFLYSNAEVRQSSRGYGSLSPRAVPRKTYIGRSSQVAADDAKGQSVSSSTPEEDFEFLSRNLSRKRSKMKDGPIKSALIAAWGISNSSDSGGGLPPILANNRWLSWQSSRTSSEHASRVLFDDICLSHQTSADVLNDIAEVENAVGALAAGQRYLQVYCDLRVIKSLLLDLVPLFDSRVIRGTIMREESPPLIVSNRIFPLIADLMMGVYVWGAGITIMYFAFERKRPLQVVWAYTLLAWFIFDCFLIQPSLVYIIKCWCPRIANRSVQLAKAAIVKNIIDLDSGVSPLIFKMHSDNAATNNDNFSYSQHSNSNSQVSPGGPVLVTPETRVQPDKAPSQLGLLLFSSARVSSGLSRFKVKSRAMNLVLKFASPYPRFKIRQQCSLFSKLRSGFNIATVRNKIQSFDYDIFAFCYTVLPPSLGTFVVEMILIGLWTLLLYFIVEGGRTLSAGYFCGIAVIAFIMVWLSPIRLRNDDCVDCSTGSAPTDDPPAGTDSIPIQDVVVSVGAAVGVARVESIERSTL